MQKHHFSIMIIIQKKNPAHLFVAYFFNPRREVLNEQLAQVVEGLEFAGLEEDRWRGVKEDNSRHSCVN